MNPFIKELRSRKFAQGEKLEPEALIIAQKILVNAGMDFIPHSYVNFLKNYNGIKAGGAYLFGATVDDELDIVDKNMEMQKPEKTILLGYNDFDLLVYNYEKNKYEVVDREDFQVIDSYDDEETDYALRQIFNV